MFLSKVDIKEFDDFVKNHPTKSHFLQSAAWGEVSKSKGLIPHYVGLKDKDKLVATALLLEKKIPMGYSYFYAPRGFVLDYSNHELIKQFSSNLKKYIKERRGIFLKIDPDLIYHYIDDKGNFIKDELTNPEIVSYLKSIGYKHLGFNKNFERSQPRYTFRIDINDNWQNIESRFSTTTKQRIKKAKDYEVEVSIGKRENIETFYNLVFQTEKRKDIIQHKKDYYYKFYDIFSKNDNVKLFLGKVYPKKIVSKLKNCLEKYEKELLSINSSDNKSASLLNKRKEIEKTINNIKERIDIFKEYQKKYPDEVYVSAHMIVFYGDKGWVLYSGNHDDLTETYANYLVYESHIKYALDHGYKIYDQFGTVGDLSPNNPLLGLHEFKRKFGGDYVEFIGEFDLITNKVMYILFTNLIPFYRKIVKAILKRRRK